MTFDPTNPIIRRCAEGMRLEGLGQNEEALALFKQAWTEATNDLEKFTSAHYVARHQKSLVDKLAWDEKALSFALKIGDEAKPTLPSLYLNIGKGYEDLEDFESAKKNYDLAHSFVHLLSANGYGKMIREGIDQGLVRVDSDR